MATAGMTWTMNWSRLPPPVNRPVPIAKNPRYSVPMRPPTRWMPTTSSESSKPSLYLNSIAMAHTPPATRPSTMAQCGDRLAHAGVMATRPATMPGRGADRGGLAVLEVLDEDPAEQRAAGATSVLTKIRPAEPLVPGVPVARAAPPLKPNQPNHRIAAPMRTSGTLCGLLSSRLKLTRLPRTSARARAAAPALMWTAVPPA